MDLQQRRSDELHIENVMLIPRGSEAIWIGLDFPNPEKVHVTRCQFVGGYGWVPRFWRRRRLAGLRPLVAKAVVLRSVWRWLP